MRLIINTASADRGGSIQVALSFLEECKGISEHQYFVFLSPNLQKEQVGVESFPGNFRFYEMDQRPSSRVFSMRPMSRLFTQLEAEIQPDCVFTTSGPAYWRPQAPHLIGYNLPHYIYRDSPFWSRVQFRDRLLFNLKGLLIRWFFRRDGDAYVVQTDDVNERLKHFLGKAGAHTVSNTCSSAYRVRKHFPDKLPLKREGEFRVLTVSALYIHKNLEIIREVVHELRLREFPGVRFILTIPQSDYDAVFGDDYLSEVMTVGPVPPVECPSLYEECDAMFLPTLLECFSASYPEAMMMQKPILTSDLGFAKTVCGEAAVYFDPLNASDITDKFECLVGSADQRARLIKLGLECVQQFKTPRQRALAFLELCQDLLVSKSQPKC
jgi:glycosyltransferase involved in cell wall biosynthesis